MKRANERRRKRETMISWITGVSAIILIVLLIAVLSLMLTGTGPVARFLLGGDHLYRNSEGLVLGAIAAAVAGAALVTLALRAAMRRKNRGVRSKESNSRLATGLRFDDLAAVAGGKKGPEETEKKDLPPLDEEVDLGKKINDELKKDK